MGWLLVFLATVSELIGVYGLNLYNKKRNLLTWIIYYGGILVSFAFLYFSFKYLSVSISYAVFIGFGTAGAVVMNMAFFDESKNFFRILSLLAIIVGVTGLKIVS
ncbi:paired small multidrug resistance pump [Virgibacillus halotolerans]|uniref:DMT family transporter n=1 Tax=Virgibacillus halotolerans TaxID=1071053 RepID=UPI0019605904|nr:SMR family transporter [Virgibacillus halotolerans]MBM7598995.1 paired small multidrug resistance pump [Virgibacillus halotolerans]